MANLTNGQIDKIWSYLLIKMSNDPFFKKKKKQSMTRFKTTWQKWHFGQVGQKDKKSRENKFTDFFDKKSYDFL
jgi:hypothetical protein